jgi:hypothetical protein
MLFQFCEILCGRHWVEFVDSCFVFFKSSGGREITALLDMRQEPRGALNRPGDQLREEAHKRCEVDEASRGLQIPSVDVNGIR